MHLRTICNICTYSIDKTVQQNYVTLYILLKIIPNLLGVWERSKTRVIWIFRSWNITFYSIQSSEWAYQLIQRHIKDSYLKAMKSGERE